MQLNASEVLGIPNMASCRTQFHPIGVVETDRQTDRQTDMDINCNGTIDYNHFMTVDLEAF